MNQLQVVYKMASARVTTPPFRACCDAIRDVCRDLGDKANPETGICPLSERAIGLFKSFFEPAEKPGGMFWFNDRYIDLDVEGFESFFRPHAGERQMAMLLMAEIAADEEVANA